MPLIVTCSTLPEATSAMKSLKATGRSCVWELVEKFHTITPTTTSTVPDSTRFNVEFICLAQKPISLKITTASAS